MQPIIFRVFDPQHPETSLATVTFRPGQPGDTGFVSIETDHENTREFLAYCLEDPLGQRTVYIHGLGHRAGPHTEDAEQFEALMSTLSHTFPRFETERLTP